MQFSNELRNTVAFLCVDEVGDDGVLRRVPKATAFLVLVDIGEGDDFWFPYVVTARHCIEETAGRPFWIRCNGEHGFVDLETRREDWFLGETTDVAVAPFVRERTGQEPQLHLNALQANQFVEAGYKIKAPQAATVSLRGGGSETSVTPTDYIEVGVGDEVVFVSLFVQHPGRERNLPIARFGNVSRMPDEPITFERTDGSEVRLTAYLAECRSWGGHSGAPVFWQRDAIHFFPMQAPAWMEWPTEKIWVQTPGVKETALLGLVSGHYDIEQEATVRGDVLGRITQKVNAGIAIVTPADAITDLFMREDVVEDRKERAEEVRSKRPKATFDTSISPAAGDDEYENFEALTRNLSIRSQRKRSPSVGL